MTFILLWLLQYLNTGHCEFCVTLDFVLIILGFVLIRNKLIGISLIFSRLAFKIHWDGSKSSLRSRANLTLLVTLLEVSGISKYFHSGFIGTPTIQAFCELTSFLPLLSGVSLSRPWQCPSVHSVVSGNLSLCSSIFFNT